jgi:hypothetical protein
MHFLAQGARVVHLHGHAQKVTIGPFNLQGPDTFYAWSKDVAFSDFQVG